MISSDSSHVEKLLLAEGREYHHPAEGISDGSHCTGGVAVSLTGTRPLRF